MIMQELGVRWNLLTDGEKAVWNERAAEDKIRYARDVRCYANCLLPSPLLFHFLIHFVRTYVFFVVLSVPRIHRRVPR